MAFFLFVLFWVWNIFFNLPAKVVEGKLFEIVDWNCIWASSFIHSQVSAQKANLVTWTFKQLWQFLDFQFSHQNSEQEREEKTLPIKCSKKNCTKNFLPCLPLPHFWHPVFTLKILEIILKQHQNQDLWFEKVLFSQQQKSPKQNQLKMIFLWGRPEII